MFDKVALEVIHNATALATCVEELDEAIQAFKSNKGTIEETQSAFDTCTSRLSMYRVANLALSEQVEQRIGEMVRIEEDYMPYAS